ncbi:hypothetical protein EK21DRAFT_114019 [Setomelanomma holmii]|uniref:Uncharacterized protein n=1 Tax=Setomelanomma holmii TaxID=210430 RepID=A0A9P4LKI1_9PLEO|nr:hypothetical protein EK21DRAFT_114019 [Setomelanomma holmii]
MARQDNLRMRNARKRRRDLVNTQLHIGTHHDLRKLKRSTRKKLAKESAPRLWIFPWLAEVSLGYESRIHFRASLLGLPIELRQKIIHQSYTKEDLLYDVEVFRNGRGSRETRMRRILWVDKDQPTSNNRHDMSQRQGQEKELFTILNRRISGLSRVSRVLYEDMKSVGRRWRADLDKWLGKQQEYQMQDTSNPAAVSGLNALAALQLRAPVRARKKDFVIKVRKSKPGKRVRPPKCWYCTERHHDGYPICPMAKRDQGKWRKMTSPVGEQRSTHYKHATFKRKKTIFAN